MASFTKNEVVVSAFTTFAETVMFDAVVLARDNPISVAVLPLATVAVTVVGLLEVPILGVAIDLNAIRHPNAIAIATE